MADSLPTSIPRVADVVLYRGVDADAAAGIDFLIEVPHGATSTDDFDQLADELEGPHPDGLVDFFHANTDVGAPELAAAVAERWVIDHPASTVLVLRSRIPRTFIDCNRRIGAPAEAFKKGGITPGEMPWVTSPADRALLRTRYDAYLALVRQSVAALCPTAFTLLLHTYGPRSVGVSVDEDTVTNLRAAYEPGIVETWPMRPELDVISRDTRGIEHAPPGIIAALREAFADLGWSVGASETYPMHPSALAWDHVRARPGRVLCLEVRRDLVAVPFDPFTEMTVGRVEVDRIAERLVKALNESAVQ